MSLDVYLNLPGHITHGGNKIFIREKGAMQEISREEWNARHPEYDPVFCAAEYSDEVYTANITHNMGDMAGAVDLYRWLWHPDKSGVVTAKQLIEPLRNGLFRLIEERKSLLHLNPDNGWGNYNLLVEFTRKYLIACEDWPDATVSVSR